MTEEPKRKAAATLAPGLFEPLGERTFRIIWAASLLSNFGQLIQGVGAAWEMARLTGSPTMVALVQSAIMLPLMLVSLPAGAVADMFDRRKVAITGLVFATLSAAGLTLCALSGLVSPWLLLSFCFLIGTGVALYGPAWQSSLGELVNPRLLPSAVALGSVSYNIARSFGPAIGGVVIAIAGSVAAFGINALFYLPLLIAFLLWRRPQFPARLPPERIDRAMISGVRYVVHSPPIRIVIFRTLISSLAGASISALMPLVAKDQLGGGASVYGLLLGAFGVGAVLGALGLSRARAWAPESSTRALAVLCGLMIALVGLSDNMLLTCLALLVGGAAWMLLIALFNVGVQLSAPRWVTARALACFQSAVTGGMAFGAWGWGYAAGQWGTGLALVVSGLVFCVTPLLGLLLPMPTIEDGENAMIDTWQEPEVALDLTLRSGPVIIEIAYSVDTARARDFYGVMQRVRRAHLRTGAFNWSLSRDIADARLWIERFQCPTWGDYLRQRSRLTQADLQAQAEANAFHLGAQEGRVRRRLERPFGSVRWSADTPDFRQDTITVFTP